MSIKVGDKFILEVGEVFKGAESGVERYRIKGFDTLTFDKRGLKKLEPVKTTNVEDTNEYQIGYRVGYEERTKECEGLYTQEEAEKITNDAYSKALEDLGYAMRVYFPLNSHEQLEYFGTNIDVTTFAITRPKELIAMVKSYEKKKQAENELKCGDVVKFNEKLHSYDQNKDREYILLHVFDNGTGTLLHDNGDTSCASLSLLDKTGRHIDEVSQLLDKLRGEKE